MLSMLSPCILLVTSITVFSMTSAATIASSSGFCMHGAKPVYPGESVALQDCQYKCKCVVNEGYSFFMCEPLCERYYDQITCSDGQEAIMELEETSVPECKCPKYECPPERFSVSHFIDYGIDGDGFFEPEFYEEGESPYYE